MIELTLKNLFLTAITILLIFHLKNYSHSWKTEKLSKSSTNSEKVKKLTTLQLFMYSPAILVYLVGKFLNLAFKIIIYTILDCAIWVLDKALEADLNSIVVKVKNWSSILIESVKGLGIKVADHLSHLYWTNYHNNLVNFVNYVQLEFNNLSIKVIDYSVKFKNYSITHWNTVILPKLDSFINTIIIPLVSKLYQLSSSFTNYLNTAIIPAIKALDFSKLFSLIELEYIMFNLIPKLFGYTLGGIKFLITHSNYLFSLTKLKELTTHYYPIIVHKLEQGSIKALDWLESDGIPKLKQFIVYFVALSKSLISTVWDKFCYSLEFHIIPLISHLFNTIPKIYNWANHKYNQVKPIVYSVWINQLLPLISQLGQLSNYLNIAFCQAYVELREISNRLVVMANEWYDSIRELDGVVNDKVKKQ